jgi:uridine kinase
MPFQTPPAGLWSRICEMTRKELVLDLALRISRIPCAHPVRVAIDGVDAAGKTSLADELVAPLERLGRPVIRASIDGFHNPSSVRYRRGETSAEGYFRDSFNYPALIEALLYPLDPAGDRQFRRAIFDVRANTPVESPVENAAENAALLFDGVFLLIPELRPYWDYSVFVRAAFDVTLARAETRDRELFGSASKTRARYEQRYVPGQRLYLAEVDPGRHASVIVDNDDVTSPRLSAS